MEGQSDFRYLYLRVPIGLLLLGSLFIFFLISHVGTKTNNRLISFTLFTPLVPHNVLIAPESRAFMLHTTTLQETRLNSITDPFGIDPLQTKE